YARLYRLDVIAHAGNENYYGYIGRFDDLDLILTDANSFDDHFIKACCIKDRNRIDRCSRKPSEIAAGRHRTDKDILIEAERCHPDTIAKDGTAGKWAGRVNAD